MSKTPQIRLFHTRGDRARWRTTGVLQAMTPHFNGKRDPERYRAHGEPIKLTYEPQERTQWMMRSPLMRGLFVLEALLAVAGIATLIYFWGTDIVDGSISAWHGFTWLIDELPGWFDDWLRGQQRSSTS